MKGILKISEEVGYALEQGKPVVALESTIISHGMPYPDNVKTALTVEKTVRENGAVPATIAIIKGVPTVGLSEEEIEHLGKEGTKVVKVSRRDIPVVIAKKLDGATTVASTMIFAETAGIKVFATGGIGGVHRGATETMDISADLEELRKRRNLFARNSQGFRLLDRLAYDGPCRITTAFTKPTRASSA